MFAPETAAAAALTGTVFAIERCSLHDGPGIRTTVFLKGCPLRCLWCHNPEALARQPELWFLAERCLSCGACVAACPHGCHALAADGAHTIDRSHCAACGGCAAACPAGALEIKGREMGVEAVLAEVEKDRDYYAASGGGLTLSGGEPLAQPEFAAALLRGARARGLHTCVETSGHARTALLLGIAPLVDLFLCDWKESDPARYRTCTGGELAVVRENLRALAGAGAAMVVRCPVVPGLNDRPDHFAGIAELAEELAGVRGIELMPYHPMGASKAARLGRAWPLPDLGFADPAAVEGWRAAIRARTTVPVQ